MSDKPDQLALLLSKWAVFVFVTIGMIPVIWQIGTAFEGRYFPVVVPAEDEEGNQLPIIAAEYPGMTEAGVPFVDIYVQFNKVRYCEFLEDRRDPTFFYPGLTIRSSLSWYDISGRRLRLEFEPEAQEQPISRPTGAQVGGPWRIFGVDTTVDTWAILVHRCHPLWLTYTKFFP